MEEFKKRAEKIYASRGIDDKRISQLDSTVEAARWVARAIDHRREELGKEGQIELAQAMRSLANKKEKTRAIVGASKEKGIDARINGEETVVVEGISVSEIERAAKTIIIDSKVDLCAENKEICVFGKSKIEFMLTSDIEVDGEAKLENVRLSSLKMKKTANAKRVKQSEVYLLDNARIEEAKLCDIETEGNAVIENSEGCIIHIKGGHRIVVGKWSVAIVKESTSAEIVVLKGGTLMVKKGVSIQSIKMEDGAAIEVE